MARYVDVHPVDPQPRSTGQVVAMLRDDALIAYPTDSCYALGAPLDNPTGADRARPAVGVETVRARRTRESLRMPAARGFDA